MEPDEKLPSLIERNDAQIVVSSSIKREAKKNTTEDTEAIQETLNIDITEETNDSLSIVKKERELIITALKRNNLKRKDAAKQLGISEEKPLPQN